MRPTLVNPITLPPWITEADVEIYVDQRRSAPLGGASNSMRLRLTYGAEPHSKPRLALISRRAQLRHLAAGQLPDLEHQVTGALAERPEHGLRQLTQSTADQSGSDVSCFIEQRTHYEN